MRAPAPFAVAFTLCVAAALTPLWIGRFLPLTDLPQYAAQISMLRHHGDAAFGYAHVFDLNFFTPYLLSTLLGAALCCVAPVMVAAKMVLSLSIVAVPMSLYFLLSESEGEPRWSLVGFPLAFGGSFFYGHMAYLLAIPVCLATWALALRHRRAPSFKTGALYVAASLTLFFCHLIPLAVALIVSSLLFLQRRRDVPLWTLIVVQVPVMVLVAVWFAGFRTAHFLTTEVLWELGMSRPLDIAQHVMGFRGDTTALVVTAATLLGLMLFRPKRKKERLAALPFLCLLALCCFAPFQVGAGLNYFPQRLAVFLVPSLLLAFQRGTNIRRTNAAGLVIVATFVAWSGVLARRVVLFNDECAGFSQVLAHAEPNKRMAGVILDKASGVKAHVPYVHFAGYYPAFIGGQFEYSFSNVPQLVVRYKPAHQLSERAFSAGWADIYNDNTFDYFLFRLPKNAALRARPDRSVIAHSGSWWLVARQNGQAS